MSQAEITVRNHNKNVRNYMMKACINIRKRASSHDLSKLESPEKENYEKIEIKQQEILGNKINDLTYPSKECEEIIKLVTPLLKHHYKNNSHHPEHFKNGVDGMSLFDILEMLCDWKAGGEKLSDGGDIYRSIIYNQKRFKISNQLTNILKNTAKEMKWKK